MPGAFVVAGKVLMWLFGVGTVILALALGCRLAGRGAGLIAGAVAAVVPSLIYRSTIVIVDTPATFFVTATLLAATAIGRGRRPVLAVLGAGALAGLAAASKYPSAAIIVAPLVVVAGTTAWSWRRRAAMAASTIGAAIVAAVVAMPALLVRRAEITEALEAQSGVYGRKVSDTTYLHDLFSSREVGVALAVPALIGVVVLLARRRSHLVTAGWLVFAVIIVGVGLPSRFQPFRNVLPLVPFLAVAAGAAVVEGARAIADRAVGARSSGSGRGARAGGILAGAVGAALVVVLLLTGAVPQVDLATGVVDSRVRAVDWLAEAVQPGQRVLVAEELAILGSELDRIPGEVVVAPTVVGTATWLPDADAFDVVVTGRFKDIDGPLIFGFAPPTVTFGRALVRPVPNLFRGSDQWVDIRVRPPKA